MNWKNISSFSRDDTDRTPNAWEAHAGGLRIVVHRHIHFPKDVWLLSTTPFFDRKQLTSKSIEEAKEEAVKLVCEKARAILADLNTET
jgi:hypothetical protein